MTGRGARRKSNIVAPAFRRGQGTAAPGRTSPTAPRQTSTHPPTSWHVERRQYGTGRLMRHGRYVCEDPGPACGSAQSRVAAPSCCAAIANGSAQRLPSRCLGSGRSAKNMQDGWACSAPSPSSVGGPGLRAPCTRTSPNRPSAARHVILQDGLSITIAVVLHDSMPSERISLDA